MNVTLVFFANFFSIKDIYKYLFIFVYVIFLSSFCYCVVVNIVIVALILVVVISLLYLLLLLHLLISLLQVGIVLLKNNIHEVNTDEFQNSGPNIFILWASPNNPVLILYSVFTCNVFKKFRTQNKTRK